MINLNELNNISTSTTTITFSTLNTNKQNNLIPFTFTKFLIALVCVIVILLSLIGNALTVSVISRYKKLKNATNYILLSLAIADLAVSICVMLPAMIQDVLQKWIFSDLFCLIYNGFDITCCTASILHLLLISIDRYMAIFNPLRYRNTVRTWHIFASVVALWFISFAMSFVPIFMGWNKIPRPVITQPTTSTISSIIKEHIDANISYFSSMNFEYNGAGNARKEDEKCILEANVTYSIISSSLSFWIPLIVMTIVYIQIYIVARRQSKAIERTIGGSKRHFSNDTTNSYLLNNNQNTTEITNDQSIYKFNKLLSNNTNSSISTNAEDKKSRFLKLIKQLKIIEKKKSKDTKAIKTLGIIMGIFIACWLPFFIMYLYVPLSGGNAPPLIIDRLITWIGYVNSFINPIIYALTNRDFRKAYISTIREITKKIFPKSFYYSTLGRNDIDSIYYNSKRTSNNNSDDKAKKNNQIYLCKFNQLMKCCLCCIKKNDLINTSAQTRENGSLISVNNISCMETTKFISNNVNKNKEDSQTDINNNIDNNRDNNNNKNIFISNFKALTEDQSSLLYIDNETISNDNDSLGQDLVVFKMNFSNDGSDNVFEQETTPQLVSFNKCEIVDISRKNNLDSDLTSCSNITTTPITNHENIFLKFRKSFQRNHIHNTNRNPNRKFDLSYELDLLKHDFEDVKDKMKDSDSFLTTNTLTDANSSKKDSLITNANNVNFGEKMSNHNNQFLLVNNKMTTSQRIKRMFSLKNSNIKRYNHNGDNNGLINCKKNSFIFFKNNNTTPVSNIIDENVTVFRV